jgi:mono/diheme cytochrome c family protein
MPTPFLSPTQVKNLVYVGTPFMASAHLLISTLLCSLALLLTACSGLGSEPRIISTLPPPTATIAERGFPLNAPDMALGAALYARHCTECHGVTGAGDGPLVQSGEVQNAGNFRDAEAVRAKTPQEWFSIITNGNLERLMPPWRDALGEAERWAVALYSYTLHYTDVDLARGREVFTTSYGESLPAALTQERLASLSDAALAQILAQGESSAGIAPLPAEANAGAQDAAAYARTLALANAQVVGTTPAVAAQPAETPELTAASVGTVRGQVINGTTGAPVPPDLPITLFFYDAELRESTLTTTADATGAFAFENVPMSETFQYAAIATYNDRSFFNPPVPGSANGTLNLSVTIYELTEDPVAITITGMVAQVTAIGDSLEVTQLFTLRNTGDRAYSTTGTTPDGRPVSLTIPLPPGAVVVGFPDGESRFTISADGAAVQDTAPVIPGSDHFIAVVYIIPYAGSAIIEQPLNYGISGPVRILVRPEGVTLTGERLPTTGVETVGQSQWNGYGGVLTYAAGDVLRYELTGAAQSVGSRDTGVVTSNNLLPIIVIVIIGEIILVAGLYLWWRGHRAKRGAADASKAKSDPVLMDGLIRQIAELDAQHERGEIADEGYQRQRALLKARLTEIMDKRP